MKNFLKFKFIPAKLDYENFLIPPEPASRHVPEWYKSLARHIDSNSEKSLYPENTAGTDSANVSTKMCPPFLDAMTAGYMYLLEDDLHVSLDEHGKPTLSWNADMLLADVRPDLDLPVPEGCHPVHYGFKMNWYYETPPGYSVLITHPMNRYDLPFYIQSGIIESDIWGLSVLITFFLKRNFRGTIPKGTPIFQMVPFKRDNWQMEIDNSEETHDYQELLAENRRSSIYAHYKKTTWIKKIFLGVGKNAKN